MDVVVAAACNGVDVSISAAGNGVGRPGVTCAKMLVVVARTSVALQKNRCTVLVVVGDDAIEFRMAGQATSPGPDENPASRTGRGGVQLMTNDPSCK